MDPGRDHRIQPAHDPVPPRMRYTKPGTLAQRILAIVGIVLGLCGGIIWGIIAYISYNKWQDGKLEYPRFAWFIGITVPVCALLAALSQSFLSAADRAGDLGADVGIAALVISVVIGLVGLHLMTRPKPAPTPPRPPGSFSSPGKEKDTA
jgi:ABC-type nickel/cobalt efflux system permease component RcnA